MDLDHRLEVLLEFVSLGHRGSGLHVLRGSVLPGVSCCWGRFTFMWWDSKGPTFSFRRWAKFLSFCVSSFGRGRVQMFHDLSLWWWRIPTNFFGKGRFFICPGRPLPFLLGAVSGKHGQNWPRRKIPWQVLDWRTKSTAPVPFCTEAILPAVASEDHGKSSQSVVQPSGFEVAVALASASVCRRNRLLRNMSDCSRFAFASFASWLSCKFQA